MRLGVVSDVHWTPGPAAPAAWHNPFDFAGLPARLDAARSLFAAARVDAVVVCGDLTRAGDAASARAVLERLSADPEAPVLAVAGNHDVEERDDLLAARCELLTGTGRPVGGARVSGVAVERDGARCRWSAQAAPAVEAPVTVVASHFPVLSRAERLAEAGGLAYPGDVADRAALHEHLRDATPVVVLSGHLHAREAHACDGVLQLSAGALVEPPHEVAIVEVVAGPGAVRVSRRAHGLGAPLDGPPVLAPDEEAWTYGTAGWRAR